MTFDVAVIGSGVGGLTAAAALARRGMRVIVFEQHYLPGGYTQSFSLGGYRFSPGAHYVGGAGPDGELRRVWERLGLTRDLELCELSPDGFDHFLIGDARIDQPRGLDRLYARFPLEREGIDRWFGVLLSVAADLGMVGELSFPAVLLAPFRAPSLLRWGFSTAGALLDACTRDPELRAILSAPCGNHGLPPSRVALPVHAVMTAHYLDGGYHPRGGGKRIAQALIKELRRRGGAIRTRTRVSRILHERGRAIGVELQSGERVHCDHVVCNADPARVFGTLLPREVCAREVKKALRAEHSVSSFSLFLAVDMRLRAMGYDSGNYWWYRSSDVEGIQSRALTTFEERRCDVLFLSISSLKDPSPRPHQHHTIELFSFVPYAAFEGMGEPGERSEAYEARKRAYAESMLEAAENVTPRLRRHVRFMRAATPLTNEFFCEPHRGACYGTAKTPWQVGPGSFGPRGPLERLWLCGASTLAHGVVGATLSGLIAAQHILGLPTKEEVIGPADGSLRVLPADRPEAWEQRPPRLYVLPRRATR